MGKSEEKQIYRVIAQKEGITITAEMAREMTKKEAVEAAINEVLGGADKVVDFQPCIAVPITTQERWNKGYINFCPRCGTNISEYELYDFADTECHECNASLNIQIHSYNSNEGNI